MSFEEKIRHYFNEHDAFARHVGITVLETGIERGVAVMPLEDRHRNAMGNAHGGAIFSLADAAFGAVANAAGEYSVNAQSSFSYLSPGRVGPLRAEARRTRAGRTLGVYEIRVTDADGALIAIGIFTGCNVHKNVPTTPCADDAP